MKLVVLAARIVFGVIAAGMALLLLFVVFIFDAPGSTSDPRNWMLAASPVVYIGAYFFSLFPVIGANGQPPTNRARLFRACWPLFGLAWSGLAWLLAGVK